MLHVSRLSLNRISRVRIFLLFLPWIGLCWQFLLAESVEDIVCSFLAASGAYFVFFDAFRPHRLYRYPFSTLVVLGFAITLQLGPLLLTANDGRTITYNLLVPYATFGNAFLSGLASLLAHAIYRNLPWLIHIRRVAHQFLFGLDLFKELRLYEVLAMSLLGIFALGFTTWISRAYEQFAPFNSIFSRFQYFSVMPIALLLQHLWRQTSSASVLYSRKWLLILFPLIALTAIGRNSRSSVFLPLACLALGLMIQWVYGLVKIRFSSVVAFGIALLICMPIATNMAVAMRMTRTHRHDVSAFNLLSLTFSQFGDFTAVKKFSERATKRELLSDWSEEYLSNPILARFANAKFSDNSLENAERLTEPARREIADYQWLRFLVSIPEPIPKIMGLTNIKNVMNGYSPGDKLYATSRGIDISKKRVVTHFIGYGNAAFGYTYLSVLVVGLLLIFPLVDSHVSFPPVQSFAAPLITVFSITQLYQWFSISNSESLADFLIFPFRGFIEPVLMFALFRWALSRVKFV